MRIEHLALWVKDLERMKDFYCTYFGAMAGKKYINPAKKFESYFLQFKEGSRLELMYKPDLRAGDDIEKVGLAHFALAVGSKKEVEELTRRMERDGFTVAGTPRTTGDGYYESVILDPEGNRIEITV